MGSIGGLVDNFWHIVSHVTLGPCGKQYAQICPNVSPASAPFQSSSICSKKKTQLVNAYLRSRNGGVGAEMCLCKVKWDCLAGRGVSISRGRPYESGQPYWTLYGQFAWLLFQTCYEKRFRHSATPGIQRFLAKMSYAASTNHSPHKLWTGAYSAQRRASFLGLARITHTCGVFTECLTGKPQNIR